MFLQQKLLVTKGGGGGLYMCSYSFPIYLKVTSLHKLIAISSRKITLFLEKKKLTKAECGFDYPLIKKIQ